MFQRNLKVTDFDPKMTMFYPKIRQFKTTNLYFWAVLCLVSAGLGVQNFIQFFTIRIISVRICHETDRNGNQQDCTHLANSLANYYKLVCLIKKKSFDWVLMMTCKKKKQVFVYSNQNVLKIPFFTSVWFWLIYLILNFLKENENLF